ncbi:MAG: ABC transporter ATP-binding protein [Anaerolineae bacterium]
MQQAGIEVRGLAKTYAVPEREPGLIAAMRQLGRRRYRETEAVKPISFTVQPGERVGFIGPNGAGKTTTLKLLSGLLYPTAGEARVAGFVPWERRAEFRRQISMVMGNRAQLALALPPMDSFQVLGEIYSVDRAELRHTLDELVALLEIESLLRKPVRNLSLGERMKCELVASLLHRPRVLFLDEPTLGLDVSTQRRLRQFIRDYNQRTGATVMLTSHYMTDVTEICERLLVIHDGTLIYDGPIGDLVRRLAPYKLLRVTLGGDPVAPAWQESLPPGVEVLSREGDLISLRAHREQTATTTAYLLAALPVVDLSIEEPPLEAVVDRIFREHTL